MTADQPIGVDVGVRSAGQATHLDAQGHYEKLGSRGDPSGTHDGKGVQQQTGFHAGQWTHLDRDARHRSGAALAGNLADLRQQRLAYG
jgi:hypothetical protein